MASAYQVHPQSCLRCPIPEGPEVKLFTDSLRSVLVGKSVARFALGGRYEVSPPPGWGNHLTFLQERFQVVIGDVACKGKLIYITLKTPVERRHVLCTLGMTGAWRPGKIDKHPVLSVGYRENDDAATEYVTFVDPRHFGTLKVVDDADLKKKLKQLGPDVLSDGWRTDDFPEIVRKAGDTNVTRFLMEQKWISGVGNYLKSEILYASRISPHRTCDSLTQPEVLALERECRSISLTSYKAGGASVRTYTDFEGKRGDFASLLQVYDRDLDPLGNNVVKFESLDGRTTHWVPALQA